MTSIPLSLPNPYLTAPIILTTLFLLLRRAYYSLRPTEKHNGLPRVPLMVSWFPFLGNALDMAGGDRFWVDAVRKYGPAIRILAVGETRTFVVTPELISYIYKSSKTFDFYYFRKLYQTIIFGMERDDSFSPAVDILFEGHRRGMQPGAIDGVIARYVDQLERCFTELSNSIVNQPREIDLVDQVYEIIYTASSKAWFTDSFPSSKTLEPFKKFDKFFPVLNLTTLPELLRSPATSARDRMLRDIEVWWGTVEEDERELLAPALMVMLDISTSEGWSDRSWNAIVLSELWALEANAPLAAIWTVCELIRHPEFLRICQTEIQNAITNLPTDSQTLTSLLHQPPSSLPQTLPMLNAAFQETLRLHTSSYSLRLVLEDTVLPASLLQGTPGGENGYSLKKDEQVICVTRHNQVDEMGDWGADAAVWDCQRFLGEKGDVGKRIRGNMYPFGGGVSMCEGNSTACLDYLDTDETDSQLIVSGRHFSSAEILTFLAAFIYQFDATVIPGGDTVTPDMQRIGLGVMQPKGAMKVRLGLRK